jgi:hypothetical protein
MIIIWLIINMVIPEKKKLPLVRPSESMVHGHPFGQSVLLSDTLFQIFASCSKSAFPAIDKSRTA